MRRRIATVLLGAALASSGVVFPLVEAHAGGCVNRREYRRVERRMLKKRVHNIFDTDGRQTSHFTIGGDSYQSREYNTCTSRWGFVSIDYKNGKVTGKFVYWG